MTKEELIEIFAIIDVYKEKYQEIAKWLKIDKVDMGSKGIKKLEWFDEKDGLPITLLKIIDKILKDLNSLANVIYDNSKRY